jgi:DNA-binding GntR family transcriptional regulator
MSWEGKLACIIFLSSKEAGRSFKEMIKSLGKKAMTKTEEKTKEPKDKSAAETVGTGPQKDATDIQALGTHSEDVVLVFEKTMAEIQREDYESQEKLLAGYKKLLEEQINVIDSKQKIAKRLKGITK